VIGEERAMLTRRQRLKWWLRESRLPRSRRWTARAERTAEMAEHADDRDERMADRAIADAEARHSRGADFHRG
jgi:hypothetical protein